MNSCANGSVSELSRHVAFEVITLVIGCLNLTAGYRYFQYVRNIVSDFAGCRFDLYDVTSLSGRLAALNSQKTQKEKKL